MLTCILVTLVQSAPHRAWIDTRKEEDKLHISGRFVNHSEEAVSLRYELQTTKEGHSGRIRSAQSGTFSASPEEEVQLSQTTVNIQTKDTYTIELKIFRGDSIYLQDKMIH